MSSRIGLGPPSRAETSRSLRDTERDDGPGDVEIVRAAFEAFLGGDQEKTAQLVDPEVESTAPWAGFKRDRARGQSEIDETSRPRIWRRGKSAAWKLMASSTPATTSSCSCTSTGAAEAVERAGRRDGGCRFSERGRVVRIQGYLDRDAALAAVGLSE